MYKIVKQVGAKGGYGIQGRHKWPTVRPATIGQQHLRTRPCRSPEPSGDRDAIAEGCGMLELRVEAACRPTLSRRPLPFSPRPTQQPDGGGSQQNEGGRLGHGCHGEVAVIVQDRPDGCGLDGCDPKLAVVKPSPFAAADKLRQVPAGPKPAA
jgi:hypothetical protein